MSESRQIVCKKCNFNVDAFFVLLCELFMNRRTRIYYIENGNFPVCGLLIIFYTSAFELNWS